MIPKKQTTTTPMVATFYIKSQNWNFSNPCKKVKYISAKELRANYPKIVAPTEVEKAAKIYNYKDGEIILINEKNKGIHIIDNRVKETPKNVAFIEIPGNVDMAIKDGYLYVDSFTDLVVMDIRDINAIKTVYRKEKVFSYDPYTMLDQSKGECYDYDSRKEDAFIIGSK